MYSVWSKKNPLTVKDHTSPGWQCDDKVWAFVHGDKNSSNCVNPQLLTWGCNWRKSQGIHKVTLPPTHLYTGRNTGNTWKWQPAFVVSGRIIVSFDISISIYAVCPKQKYHPVSGAEEILVGIPCPADSHSPQKHKNQHMTHLPKYICVFLPKKHIYT